MPVAHGQALASKSCALREAMARGRRDRLQVAWPALGSNNARILSAMFTRGVPFNPAHVSIQPT